MREHLMSIIDFTKFRGNEPTGLGALIHSLRTEGVTNLSFFDDIDTKVRNSFSHLDFKIDNDRIYCEHKPNVYVNHSWRTEEDQNQSEYILYADLLKLVVNGDRSSFTVMLGCIYFINSVE